MKKISVLVVDDSALIRQVLTRIIDSQSDMHCVGAATDPLVAREMIRSLNPDVLTLDVEMPRMDGLDFLERLMRLRPMPVVMVSTLTGQGTDATLRALELGAVDYVCKPHVDIARGIDEYAQEIADKIRAAAVSRPCPRRPGGSGASGVKVLPALGDRRLSQEKLIFVGASTGGTEAIREFLCELPTDSPGILIVQHMPAGFTQSFAARLNTLSRLTVKEAQHGERVLPGHAYIGPGDRHLSLKRSGSHYLVMLSDTEPVNRHRPSVDVLFNSAAEHAGRHAIGVIFTGMGRDGAKGMLAMKRAGAWNFAQDEASCVVFGMPKEAIATGAVDETLPLGKIAQGVMRRLTSSTGAGA